MQLAYFDQLKACEKCGHLIAYSKNRLSFKSNVSSDIWLPKACVFCGKIKEPGAQ